MDAVRGDIKPLPGIFGLNIAVEEEAAVATKDDDNTEGLLDKLLVDNPDLFERTEAILDRRDDIEGGTRVVFVSLLLLVSLFIEIVEDCTVDSMLFIEGVSFTEAIELRREELREADNDADAAFKAIAAARDAAVEVEVGTLRFIVLLLSFVLLSFDMMDGTKDDEDDNRRLVFIWDESDALIVLPTK